MLALANTAVTGTARALTTESSVRQLERAATFHYVQNGDVRLHYAKAGTGDKLLLFVHGFPGWWWTWRHLMAAFMNDYTVAALDMRGYHKSDKPTEVEKYRVEELAVDLAYVIKDAGFDRATLIGHDWGGGACWGLAGGAPEFVERLAVLNCPHPWGIERERFQNPKQQAAAQYAQAFRLPDAAHRALPEQMAKKMFYVQTRVTPLALALILSVKEPKDLPRHLQAMKMTSIQGALNYYGANWPAEPYPAPSTDLKIKCPTLCIFGEQDEFLLIDALNGTWEFVENDLRIEVVQRAEHFVHNDARQQVTRVLGDWLSATT
ncbi:MAG: alpha/beta hydrolase [Solirubrobacteraceae bacterium]|nr:alpha/beta hydrolase [Solirubrobacteraceae bacterium]